MRSLCDLRVLQSECVSEGKIDEEGQQRGKRRRGQGAGLLL